MAAAVSTARCVTTSGKEVAVWKIVPVPLVLIGCGGFDLNEGTWTGTLDAENGPSDLACVEDVFDPSSTTFEVSKVNNKTWSVLLGLFGGEPVECAVDLNTFLCTDSQDYSGIEGLLADTTFSLSVNSIEGTFLDTDQDGNEKERAQFIVNLVNVNCEGDGCSAYTQEFPCDDSLWYEGSPP
jgi:hypothetical protein